MSLFYTHFNINCLMAMIYLHPFYVFLSTFMMAAHFLVVPAKAQDIPKYCITSFELIENRFTYEPEDATYAPAHVSFSYLAPIDFYDPSVLANIQELLGREVFGEHYVAGNIEASMEAFSNAFLQAYKADVVDQGTELPGYELDFRVDTVMNANNTLVMRKRGYVYLGGAHGNPIEEYYNIDLFTGQLVRFDDVFTRASWERLSEMIEWKLKEQKGLGPSGDLTELGYYEGPIEPSETIYIQGKEMLFYYGPYLIGPYALGSSEVRFSFEELSPYFKESFSLVRLMYKNE